MRTRIEILPWQRDFLESKSTIKVLSGAADTGKSWICRFRLITVSFQFAGAKHFASATTWTQTYRAIGEEIIQFLEDQNVYYEAFGHELRSDGSPDLRKKFDLSVLAEASKAEGMIKFRNGSRVEMYSQDNLYKRIRSRAFSLGFIEEATLQTPKFFQTNYEEGIQRLRQSGYPHEMLLAMNPDWETHWIHENLIDPIGREQTESRMYNNMLKAGLSESDSKARSTIFVRKLSFLDGYNANNPERKSKVLMGSDRQVKMKYYGEWVGSEGKAFHIRDGIEIIDYTPDENDQMYITFDYGFYPDPQIYLLFLVKNSTILFIDEIVLFKTAASDHRYHLAAWHDCFLEDDAEAKKLKIDSKNYNIVGYTGDYATGSGEIRSIFSRFAPGLRYFLTVKKRELGATTIADLLNLGKFKITQKCKYLGRSLNSMGWITTTKGRGVDVQSNATWDMIEDPSELDDPYDASRYGVMCPPIYRQLFKA